MQTATEEKIMDDIRFNHFRHVAAGFLNETRAINLERDLVDFLVRLDKQHQEEVRFLNLRVTELLQIIR